MLPSPATCSLLAITACLLLVLISIEGSTTDGIVTDIASESFTPRMVVDDDVPGTEIKDISIVFSDLDGTLLHYPSKIPKSQPANQLLKLPPSSTGMRGIISSKTLCMVQDIRRRGIKFVLVSGMRTSTFLERLPYLPRADAYCTEDGGRIFYPVDDGSTASQSTHDAFGVKPKRYDGATKADLEQFAIMEDTGWRESIEELAGKYESPSLSDLARGSRTKEISERDGLLWDFARSLSQEGFVLDTKGYSSCFRVNRKQQTTVTDEKFNLLLDGTIGAWNRLSSSINLSCIDFYPETSGKKNSCLYLVSKFFPVGSDGDGKARDFLSTRAVCLCDDDNDLEMAMACKHAFVPEVSSSSMKEIIKKYPHHFTLTGGIEEIDLSGTDATEAALLKVLEQLASHGQEIKRVEIAGHEE